MQPTQRTFTDIETNYKCRLYTSNDASKYHLIYEGQQEKIADGSEVNGFYICAHTPITIKTNKGNEIKLSTNNFYHLKENEIVTHKKYAGFSRFTKI